MRYLELTNTEKQALVDDIDYDRCSLYNWRLSHGVIRITDSRNYGSLNLTNFIMKTRGIKYDHRDRNLFNNQRSNLRITNNSQNSMNRAKWAGCTSKYKGVTYAKANKNWRASIRYNGHYHHIGCFKNEIDAARAYDKAAIEYHKDFAVLNFPI